MIEKQLKFYTKYPVECSTWYQHNCRCFLDDDPNILTYRKFYLSYRIFKNRQVSIPNRITDIIDETFWELL